MSCGGGGGVGHVALLNKGKGMTCTVNECLYIDFIKRRKVRRCIKKKKKSERERQYTSRQQAAPI